MTPLRKPLAECTVALVTTAGLSLPDQPPFDTTIKSSAAEAFLVPADMLALVAVDRTPALAGGLDIATRSPGTVRKTAGVIDIPARRIAVAVTYMASSAFASD